MPAFTGAGGLAVAAIPRHIFFRVFRSLQHPQQNLKTRFTASRKPVIDTSMMSVGSLSRCTHVAADRTAGLMTFAGERRTGSLRRKSW
jgi:hypothetical protein